MNRLAVGELGPTAVGVGPLGAELRRRIPAIAGWVLPFALVLVLAFENGGYDIGVRSEVGIAVWWIVLVGAASGMLNFGRIGRAGWLIVGLTTSLALWTGLGIAWSESSERSVTELARVVTYLGVLLLAFTLQGRSGIQRTVSAVASAIALVGIVALLSRLHPGWFGSGIDTTALGIREWRLNYPLNYWNGLAALMALGIPLLLTLALRARALIAQALAAAAIPALALTAFYTLSRGGAVEVAVALVAFIALYPRRLAAMPTVLAASAGSAILIAAATERDALETGLVTEAARRQGDEMLAFTLVVCAGVALLQVALGLARRYRVGPRVEVPRAATVGAGALVVGIALAIAVGPADLGERWENFKDPAGPGAELGAGRFESGSGSGRYQSWSAAVDAFETEPVAGIGPGTYEFWWAREGDLPGFVRDAHSLYLETLGELGIVGFVLVVSLLGSALVLGIARALRASEEKRAWLSGAIAACAAFATAAAIDWVWELAAVTVVFVLLLGAIAGPGIVRRRIPRSREPTPPLSPFASSPAGRLGVAAVSIAALIAIVIPYAGAGALADSAEAARADDLREALERADAAEAIQPYAASPALQQALVLQLQNRLDPAARAAREATEAESTNWRTWIALSAIEARRGNAEEAVSAYRRARSLNPNSALFQRSLLTLSEELAPSLAGETP